MKTPFARWILPLAVLGAFLGGGVLAGASETLPIVMWTNHLDFVAGDPSVVLEYNAVNSGVGGGLSGLIISSTTIGDAAAGGGNKVIEKGLDVPPGFQIAGVRVCYELSSASSFVSQIRLAQLQNPPSTALVLLDDPKDLTDKGPVCVNSTPPLVPATPIDPARGAVRLSLRVNFGDTDDRIVLRGVALRLKPDHRVQDSIDALKAKIAALEALLKTHTHTYLTGKGEGHNNTAAATGPATLLSTPKPPPVPLPTPVPQPNPKPGARSTPSTGITIEAKPKSVVIITPAPTPEVYWWEMDTGR